MSFKNIVDGFIGRQIATLHHIPSQGWLVKSLFLLLTLKTFPKVYILLLPLFKVSKSHHPSLPPTPLPPPRVSVCRKYVCVLDRGRQTDKNMHTVTLHLHFFISGLFILHSFRKHY